MTDIDQIIAGGAGSGTTADFSGIPKILDYFYKGRDEAAKNDLRTAFSPANGGVPLNSDGSLDLPSVMKTLFQKGDIAGGVGLAGAAAGAADRTALMNADSPQQQPIVGPSTSRNSVTIDPSKRTGASVPSAAPQGDQPGSIVGLVSSAGIPDELAGPVIQQVSALTKTDPNATLDPQTSQRVQQVVMAAAQRMKSGQPQGAPQQPQVAQAPPQVQQVAQPQPVMQQQGQPSPVQQAPQNDPILKRLTFLAASQDKATAAAAQTRLKSYLAGQEPTPEMKNAAAYGVSLPAYQEKQGELAAQQAGATEMAKTYVAKYNAIDEAGTKAIQEIPKLQTALKLMDSPDFYSGIGNNYNTALKRVAVAMGGDPNKAAPQEIVGKVIADSVLNGLGALKGLGPIRVAEMNLASKAAMSPDNTPQTNRFLANVAIRLQQRAVAVSDMAQNYNDGVLDVGFDKKIRAEDKKHPLLSADEVQRFQNIIDGKEKQTSAPASAAPTAYPNARQAPDGNWYVPDPSRGPNKYLRVAQ